MNKRVDYGYTDSLSLTDKLKISAKRLEGIKSILVERELELPFEVEPKRKQSRIPFSPSFNAEVTPTAKSSLNTPTSSSSFMSRRTHPSDLFRHAPEPAKRHKLEVRISN